MYRYVNRPTAVAISQFHDCIHVFVHKILAKLKEPRLQLITVNLPNRSNHMYTMYSVSIQMWHGKKARRR